MIIRSFQIVLQYFGTMLKTLVWCSSTFSYIFVKVIPCSFTFKSTSKRREEFAPVFHMKKTGGRRAAKVGVFSVDDVVGMNSYDFEEFSKIGVPKKKGWFIMENPIKMG